MAEEYRFWLNNLDDLAFGLAVSVFTCCIGTFLRSQVILSEWRIRNSLKTLTLELIGMAELTVISFELNYIGAKSTNGIV